MISASGGFDVDQRDIRLQKPDGLNRYRELTTAVDAREVPVPPLRDSHPADHSRLDSHNHVAIISEKAPQIFGVVKLPGFFVLFDKLRELVHYVGLRKRLTRRNKQ